MERRGHRFVRYAADLLVVVHSLRAAERVKAGVTKFLTTRLRLVVNEQKSRVARTDECVFLGFTFQGSTVRWSDRSFIGFKHRVRRLTGRSWGGSMEYRLYKLVQYLRSMAYFGTKCSAVAIGKAMSRGRHSTESSTGICYSAQSCGCLTRAAAPRCAANQPLTSVVREICTLRSVGARGG